MVAVYPNLHVASAQLGGQLGLNALGQSYGIVTPGDGVGVDSAHAQDKSARGRWVLRRRLNHQVIQVLALERTVKGDQVVARRQLFAHPDRANAQ